MTKILKIKVGTTTENGLTHYIYPKEYNAEKIDITAYKFASNTTTQGSSDEYCIGVVADSAATEFLKSKDITEITKAAALNDGRTWRPQYERISDEKKVISICKKILNGETLSVAEKDAIDVEKSTAGITKTAKYDTILDRSITRSS